MYNFNSGYGRALLHAAYTACPTFGKVLVVCPSTDTNYDKLTQIVRGDPDGKLRLFTTFAAAYSAATTNCDDVILLAGNGSHVVAAMVTMSKSRIHVVGLSENGKVNSQGSKLTLTTALSTDVAVIYNTGTRNSFRNLKIINSSTDTAQLYAMIDAGEGTYMENCSVQHDTILSTANVASFLCAADTANYKHCTFGSTTVYRTGNPSNSVLVGSYLGAYARYTYFEDCNFEMYSSQTTSRHVGTTGTTHVIGWVCFQRCNFINGKLGDGATAGGALAASIVSALTSGYLLVDNQCSFYNVSLACSANSSNLNAAGVAVASANGGVAVAGA